MKLTVLDRLTLGKLFPHESGMVAQLLVKDISKKIEFTQDELKEIGMKQVGGNISWNAKKAKDSEVAFTEMELNFLKEQVERLDKEQKISQEMLPLCLAIRDNKTN